jgi:hypothetical protein
LEVQRQEIQVDLPDEVVCWSLEEEDQSRSLREQVHWDDRDFGQAFLDNEEEKPADRADAQH